MDLEEARAALEAQQGPGARYDAPGAPTEALLMARRGTAYVARILDGFARPAWEAGGRRACVAKLSYEARHMAEALAALRGGAGRYAPPTTATVRQGASLPLHALQHFFRHSAAHLDVEWRDLGTAHWHSTLRGEGGRNIAVRDVPGWRAACLWQAALDLGPGRLRDVPAPLRESMREPCVRNGVSPQ